MPEALCPQTVTGAELFPKSTVFSWFEGRLSDEEQHRPLTGKLFPHEVLFNPRTCCKSHSFILFLDLYQNKLQHFGTLLPNLYNIKNELCVHFSLMIEETSKILPSI